MAPRAASARMRLLLDEHLSPAVAAGLRDLGHDAIAIAERPDLRGRPDDKIFAAAAAEHRVIVSSDVADVLVLTRQLSSSSVATAASSSCRHPAAGHRGRAAGRLIARLAATMAENPADDAFDDRVEWLPDPAIGIAER